MLISVWKFYTSKFQKAKSTRREFFFHADKWKHKIGFVLFKVKHDGSQYYCAISYLQWIVISIACSTRSFSVPWKKEYKENKRKKEEESHPLTPPSPPSPLGGRRCLQHLPRPPAEPSLLHLHQARYPRLCRPPNYFPVLALGILPIYIITGIQHKVRWFIRLRRISS